MEKTCRLVHLTYRENNRGPGQEEYKHVVPFRLDDMSDSIHSLGRRENRYYYPPPLSLTYWSLGILRSHTLGMAISRSSTLRPYVGSVYRPIASSSSCLESDRCVFVIFLIKSGADKGFRKGGGVWLIVKY